MTFYYIIADSYDDFLDYINRYEIPECDSKFVKYVKDINIINKPFFQHHVHITKFAARDDVFKVKFVDMQIALSQKASDVKTFIETELGVVTSANISFLKL